MEFLLHAAISHLLKLAVETNGWRLMNSWTDPKRGMASLEFELARGTKDAPPDWKPDTPDPTEYKHVRFDIQVTE